MLCKIIKLGVYSYTPELRHLELCIGFGSDLRKSKIPLLVQCVNGQVKQIFGLASLFSFFVLFMTLLELELDTAEKLTSGCG